MPIYDWVHKITGEERSVRNSIANYDRLPDGIDPDDADNWHLKVQKPAIFKRLIPSGFGIREKDGNWQAGKEIAALEDSTLDMPVQSKERAAIKEEVKKIKRSTIK